MIRIKLKFSEQEKILRKCLKQGIDLEDELNRIGLSYEDLRYRFNDCDPSLLQMKSKSFVPLEDYTYKKSDIPFVGFFSGAGGLDLGFSHAGFRHEASVEINELFCKTLRKNFKNSLVIGPPDYSGDARKREEILSVLKKKLGIGRQYEGVFIGGPPCQPFSIAANQRFSKNGKNFKRIGFAHAEYGNLLFDFVHFVSVLKPKAFLIENVAGLLTADGEEEIASCISFLRKSGYDIFGPMVLNASNYGVPQNRQRAFIIGSRVNKNFSFPSPENEQVACSAALERVRDNDKNHVTRNHKAESIIRYVELKYGERDPLGRVDRLDPLMPSKTVIAGGTKGGGRSHLHPQVPRTLSARESARLQTFPDDFEFEGPIARQFTQVGNAVPPLLAMKIARSMLTQFFGVDGHS